MTNTPTYNFRAPVQRSRNEEPSADHRLLYTVVVFVVALVAVVSGIITYRLIAKPYALKHPEVRSGLFGYCIDLSADGSIDTEKCDGSPSQSWIVANNQFVYDKKYCLSTKNNGSSQGDLIVSTLCSANANGQRWAHFMDGYQNPSSGLCLETSNNTTNTQLILGSCNNMTEAEESWTPSNWEGTTSDASDTPCEGTEGERVACFAKRQWAAWQLGSTMQNALLTDYTDSNPYEEWCADFVSYVYKEAGYPFSAGERNGWDEYDASNIQNMGFIMHPAGSYIPRPGDVAFFDYLGGHVEIVVVGGKNPTFIYGDAGTLDPAIGNGQMSENGFTSDGAAGQVQYYLSPSTN